MKERNESLKVIPIRDDIGVEDPDERAGFIAFISYLTIANAIDVLPKLAFDKKEYYKSILRRMGSSGEILINILPEAMMPSDTLMSLFNWDECLEQLLGKGKEAVKLRMQFDELYDMMAAHQLDVAQEVMDEEGKS